MQQRDLMGKNILEGGGQGRKVTEWAVKEGLGPCHNPGTFVPARLCSPPPPTTFQVRFHIPGWLPRCSPLWPQDLLHVTHLLSQPRLPLTSLLAPPGRQAGHHLLFSACRPALCSGVTLSITPSLTNLPPPRAPSPWPGVFTLLLTYTHFTSIFTDADLVCPYISETLNPFLGPGLLRVCDANDGSF